MQTTAGMQHVCRIHRRHRSRPALLGAALLLLNGCASLFFYPMREHQLTPDAIGLEYRDVWVESESGQKIHGWLLIPDQPSKATIVHLHGNAQNISTHLAGVYWLPRFGFSVLLIDYRGYGRSEGTPTIAGIHQDAAAVLRDLLRGDGPAPAQPIILLGQSLGGAAAITVAGQAEFHCKVNAVIADSAFSSFRGILADKFAQFLLAWPFQRLAGYTLPSDFEPLNFVAGIAPVPLLLLHNKEDPVVPAHHSLRLYDQAQQPKELWLMDGDGHPAFGRPELREALVEYLERAARTAPCE